MIKNLSLLLLSLSCVSAQSGCPIEIESVQQNSGVYTLILKHSEKCEILMEHNSSQVSLVSKPYRETSADFDTGTSPDISKIDKIIALAKSKLGDSYKAAKAGPDHFDCSGFVYYVFKTNGIQIPRSSLPQSQSGDKLTREQIRRGDILFFDTHDRKHINHSGIYLGEGKFIHSSSGKAYGVTISDLDKGFYKDKFRWGVRKVEK